MKLLVGILLFIKLFSVVSLADVPLCNTGPPQEDADICRKYVLMICICNVFNVFVSSVTHVMQELISAPHAVKINAIMVYIPFNLMIKKLGR